VNVCNPASPEVFFSSAGQLSRTSWISFWTADGSDRRIEVSAATGAIMAADMAVTARGLRIFI
jgi:hypothetical protein